MSGNNFIEGFHNKEEVEKMTCSQLGNTGINISKMSLGGGPFGGLYESITEEEVINIVHSALKSGINYIDTAPWYGQGRSEAALGKALKDIPRSAYFIGTKVGRYEKNISQMFDFSAKRVFSSVDQSLSLLGLDYVDIIQVHDVEFAPSIDMILNETLPAVEKIVKQGKARFIGITGYHVSLLKEIVERSTVKIDTVLSYARNTIIDDEFLRYIPFFEERNIGIIDAAPLGMGILSSAAGPMEWHPAAPELKDRAKAAVDFCKTNNADISDLTIKHSASQSGINTILSGAASLEILRKSLKSFTSTVTKEEKKLIEEVRVRYFGPNLAKNWEGDVKKYFAALERES